MGRELRMVPPNYEHPKVLRRNGQMDYKPMFDREFDDAAKEWKEEFAKWEAGEHPSYSDKEARSRLEYWEWNGMPPEREYYRPYKDEEAT